MFAIVTSALTGALVLAAPAAHAIADQPAQKAQKAQPTPEVAQTAGAALDETSDLFGDLGGHLEKTLGHGASLSTDVRRTTSNPLGRSGDLDKELKSSMADATKLSKLVGSTADSVVNGVDDFIGRLH